MKAKTKIDLSPKAAEIVAHARELLVAGSYDSFSYADISDRVHISKPSIHHHFPSKSELVRCVVAQYREEALEGMAALDRHLSDPLEKLNAYVNYWSKCISDGSATFCICAMLAVEAATLPSDIANEVRGHFQDLLNWLTSILEKGERTGQFRLIASAAVEAKAFMAASHGAMADARALKDPKVYKDVTQLAIAKLTAVN